MHLTIPSDGHMVVCYDGSPAAQWALLWAVAVSQAFGAALRIVHAVELDLVPSRRVYALRPLSPPLETVAETLVGGPSTWSGQPMARSRVRAVHAFGGAAGELVDASMTAELVVMGTRGRGLRRNALARSSGSVSCAVAAHAYCPVVVLHDRGDHVRGDDDVPVPGPGREVVCALSAGEGEAHEYRAERIVSTAARIAAACSAQLRLVTVLPEPSPEPGPDDAVLQLPYAVDSLRRRHPGLAVTTEALHGEPVEVLTQTSRSCGVLVVGAPGHVGLRAAPSSSPAYRILHDATCPVMLVP